MRWGGPDLTEGRLVVHGCRFDNDVVGGEVGFGIPRAEIRGANGLMTPEDRCELMGSPRIYQHVGSAVVE